jgi:hypothetical protein
MAGNCTPYAVLRCIFRVDSFATQAHPDAWMRVAEPGRASDCCSGRRKFENPERLAAEALAITRLTSSCVVVVVFTGSKTTLCAFGAPKSSPGLGTGYAVTPPAFSSLGSACRNRKGAVKNAARPVRRTATQFNFRRSAPAQRGQAPRT